MVLLPAAGLAAADIRIVALVEQAVAVRVMLEAQGPAVKPVAVAVAVVALAVPVAA